MNTQRENDELDMKDMRQLLTSWQLSHLERHFQAEKISTDILQMMNLQHVAVIMRGFPLGDQIRFEFNLEQWRYNIGRPLKSNATAITMAEKPRTTAATETTLPLATATTTTAPTSSVATQTKPINDCINGDSQAAQFSAPSPHFPLHETGAYQMDMRRILETCQPLGPKLLRDYARSKRLKKSQRADLINTLARYFTDNGIHLSLHMSYALEREILKVFPNERLEDYRTERRGKIYMRVCNLKHYRNKNKRLQNEEYEREEKEKEQEQREQLVRDSTTGEELMSLSYSGEEDTLDSEKAAPIVGNEGVAQLAGFQCAEYVVKQEFVDVGLGDEAF